MKPKKPPEIVASGETQIAGFTLKYHILADVTRWINAFAPKHNPGDPEFKMFDKGEGDENFRRTPRGI